MIGITKEGLNGTSFLERRRAKHLKDGFIIELFKENKPIKYIVGIAGICITVNMALIYSFCKILIKM